MGKRLDVAVLGLVATVGACRGNPTASLDRGAAITLAADPTVLILEDGESAGLILEAKDRTNQAVELLDLGVTTGAVVTARRDSTYNRVYDRDGKLVLPAHPTRARFVVEALSAGTGSFALTANGLETTITVTVLPASAP